jgi:dephospho-CoA kinase
MADIRIFGLTGGLASGKSSVAEHWRSRRLPVIDADSLAREVVAPGSEALDEIVQAFGPSMLQDGALDRRRLAAVVFSNPEALRDLESITHPRIERRRAELLAALEARGEPLACYEVPLLFEKGMEVRLRPVVVVTAPEPVQIARARARDGASEDEVRARLAAQLPLAAKAARADYVIDNSASPATTRAQSDRVLEAICEELGLDPSRYARGGGGG